MKRILITVVVILIGFPLVLGGILGLTYHFTDDSSVPDLPVMLMDQKLEANGYDWHTPVFAGMLYKDFRKSDDEIAQDVGHLELVHIPVELPSGYTFNAKVSLGGNTKWEGPGEELGGYFFEDTGEHVIELSCNRAASKGNGYGTILYRAKVNVTADPRFEVSSSQASQGDMVAFRVFNLPEQVEIVGETILGTMHFVETGPGQMTGYLGISYSIEPATYTVTVQVGNGGSWRVPIDVVGREYTEREDEYDWGTMGAPMGQVALNQKAMALDPLYEEGDPELYWTEPFRMPVQGDIINEYGVVMNDNISYVPTRHTGVDIRAEEGTPVKLPAGGRVVFAQELMNTGNTVVVEHGAGVKSYFFHLNEILVGEGEMLSVGQDIGTVGMTGAAVEPHLHYEVRVGERPVDPMPLLDGSSDVYEFFF